MQEQPLFRVREEELVVVGTMAVYDAQAEASAGIPGQWREFLGAHPGVEPGEVLYGASPCTGDGKIHYLTGAGEGSGVRGERLVLPAGEYGFVRVEDPARLRETWIWLLRSWLPGSGRREGRTPEFERYTGISEAGVPVGAVEIWIPLEPLA